MRRRLLRTLAHAVGVVLIGFVLWSVGWNDTVIDASGARHTGRLLDHSESSARLRSDGQDLRLRLRRPGDARVGLRAAFGNLWQGPGWAAAGLMLHLLALLVSFGRWRILLSGAGLPTPWPVVLRLSWVGQFFGALLPGGVGSGDLAKALYVARSHAGRRTRSVVTVFVDRGLGLLALCVVAGAAVLAAPSTSRLPAVRGVVLALLGTGVVVLALLFSRRLRKRVQLSRLAGWLPFQRVVGELGEAGAIYGRRPGVLAGAIAISFLAHSCILAAFYCYGRALGFEMGLLAVGAAIPVAQMLSAIPALPGGWGVGDAAFLAFLPAAGVAPGSAVALSITYRILQTLLSLPGALWLSGARRNPVRGA